MHQFSAGPPATAAFTQNTQARFEITDQNHQNPNNTATMN